MLARGGGGTWVTGSYDPELNTLYWGTGNPNPDYYGEDRKGNNLSGLLSTASGVVFGGDNEGNFMAFDARTGKNVWHYQTGSPIWGGAPMTYMLNGRQYVVIGSGSAIMAFALP